MSKDTDYTKLIFIGTDVHDLKFDERNFIITFNLIEEERLVGKKANAINIHRYCQDNKIWKEIVKFSEEWYKNWMKKKINEQKHFHF